MYCQKCGTQQPEGTVFCSLCGTQQDNGATPTVSVQNQALSMKDFLALSPEYEAKREEFRKKITISTVLGASLFFIFILLGGILLFIVGFPIFVLCLILGGTALGIGATRESKFRKQLEKYGEDLFRNYMSKK